MTQTLKIKSGDLIKHKEGTVGLVYDHYAKSQGWFYVFCEGRKQRWHISNIDLI